MSSNESLADVVVLAAGKGERMLSTTNKMFHKIKGVPLLYRTLARLDACVVISRIIAVIQEGDHKKYQDMLLKFGMLQKVETEVWGGRERSDSVRNGLKFLLSNPGADIVMTHDGARPFFSENLVKEVITAARTHEVVIPTLRIYETIRQKYENEPAKVVDRDKLFIVQTPQAFQTKSIDKMFFGFNQLSLNLTDEAAYFEHMNRRVYFVEGEKWNIKITTKDDIGWADLMLDYYPFLRLAKLDKL